MEYISIIGIGVLSNLGNDVDTVWENLMNPSTDLPLNRSFAIPFASGLTSSQKKRSNRYSEIGIYISKMAIHDAKIDITKFDKNRIGSIFTTGYGPIVSSLEFSKSVVQGDTEFCSPALFANSVNNACVGHICMFLGIKGVSTVLMGSNNLDYAKMLMQKGDTDLILTGSIEEYCKELQDAMMLSEYSKNTLINEAAVAFLIAKNTNMKIAYAHIVDFLECNINGYPLTNKIDAAKTKAKIMRITAALMAKHNIDAVFSSCNGSYFDAIEIEALQKVCNKDIIYVNNIKNLFGETLGSAFNLNIMIASLCIKNGHLPSQLDMMQNKVKGILVSGYDISGNYMLAVVTANN